MSRPWWALPVLAVLGFADLGSLLLLLLLPLQLLLLLLLQLLVLLDVLFQCGVFAILRRRYFKNSNNKGNVFF